MSSDLAILKVKDLKEKCKALGLPVSGTKANLISRIQAKIEPTSHASFQALSDLQRSLPVVRKQTKRSAEGNEHVWGKTAKAVQRSTLEESDTTSKHRSRERGASFAIHSLSSQQELSTDHRNSIQHDTIQDSTVDTLNLEYCQSKGPTTTVSQLNPEQHNLLHDTVLTSPKKKLHKSPLGPQDLSILAKQSTEVAEKAPKLSSVAKAHSTNTSVSGTIRSRNFSQLYESSAKPRKGKVIVRFLSKVDTVKSSTDSITTATIEQKCSTRPLDKDITSTLLWGNSLTLDEHRWKDASIVLALTASYLDQDQKLIDSRIKPLPSLTFLNQLGGINRGWKLATQMSYSHLLDMHFPGQRTEIYKQKFSSSLYDLRRYYLHRLSEMSEAITRLKDHWVERVWTLLISNGMRDMVTHKSHELVFTGIRKELLCNPDCDKQINVALKFWIQRFTYYTNGGASKELITVLQDEQVVQAIPVLPEEECLNQTSEAVIWKIETLDNSVYFVLYDTGEVVGWRAKDGKNTQNIIQSTYGVRLSRKQSLTRINSPHINISKSSIAQRNKTNDLCWKDLRQDWREFIEVGQKSLTNFIYCPKPSTFLKGIHKSIQPPQLAVAQTFVLTHVMASGISGTPMFEMSYQATHSFNHNFISNKIQLDLDPKYAVESVKCSGEYYKNLLDPSGKIRKVLAPGVAIVQTPEMGYFVLEETGQEIGDVEHGIQNMWCTILGVDEQGHALEKHELEKLDNYFHFTENIYHS